MIDIYTIKFLYKIQSASVLLPLIFNIIYVSKNLTSTNRDYIILSKKSKVHLNESWILILYFLFTFMITEGLHILNLIRIKNSIFVVLHTPIEVLVYCYFLFVWLDQVSLLKKVIYPVSIIFLVLGIVEFPLQSLLESFFLISVGIYAIIKFQSKNILFKRYYSKMILGIICLGIGYLYFSLVMSNVEIYLSAFMQIVFVITGYILISVSALEKLKVW